MYFCYDDLRKSTIPSTVEYRFTAQPSVTDLHNFFGLVLTTVRYPYNDDSICVG